VVLKATIETFTQRLGHNSTTQYEAPNDEHATFTRKSFEMTSFSLSEFHRENSGGNQNSFCGIVDLGLFSQIAKYEVI
jgi:hypothetical protein